MISRIRLAYLKRQTNRRREEWRAAGHPDSGPERTAMILAATAEGRYRYRKLMKALDAWEETTEPFKVPDLRNRGCRGGH